MEKMYKIVGITNEGNELVLARTFENDIEKDLDSVKKELNENIFVNDYSNGGGKLIDSSIIRKVEVLED